MIPDEDFLALLEELRVLLAETEVERYNYFINNSPDGRECRYALKCLKLFRDQGQRRQLEDLLNRIWRESHHD